MLQKRNQKFDTKAAAWAGRITQAVEQLPSKREALSSNSSTTKKEKSSCFPRKPNRIN
jgi:hypothetical protein